MNRLKLTDFAPKNTFRSKLRFLFRAARNWFIIGTAAVFLPPGRFRCWWLRRSGAKIHPSVFLAPLTFIEIIDPKLITIEADVVIGLKSLVQCHFIRPATEKDIPQGIKLGEWFDNPPGKTKYIKANSTYFRLDLAPTTIKQGGFVGAFSDVTPGTIIEEGAILAQNSTTRPFSIIPAGTIYGGNPARFIKKR